MTERYTTIKQSKYDDLLGTLQRQIKKIKELEVLKAELLDENQSMSTELRRIECCSISDPQNLIDKANKQL